MYGLVIANSDGEDVVKVASSKEKLLTLAESYMKEKIKKIKVNSRDPNYKDFLDALKVKELEAAMEFFSVLTEKYGKAIYLVTAKVEFELDA